MPFPREVLHSRQESVDGRSELSLLAGVELAPLLGEAFESYHALGLALLVAATWLVARPRRPA